MERSNAVEVSFFGRGSISLLPPELRKRGVKRGLVITDSYLYKSGAADKVGERLLEAGAEYAIYYLVQPNPTVEIVNECLDAARTLQVDFLAAVGGGSAIDTAKAVSIVLGNGGKVEDYEGVNRSERKGVPIVAVNTTAGTGSEVTSFYIVTDPRRRLKMCMVDPNCMVSIAVNDVDFMMSMPPKLTAATGMDAMTHAIEAVLSKKAVPITDKDALWAITVIKDHLLRAFENGSDVEAREMMAYAEYTAGMAFSNAGLGMVHAMAHALGGMMNLPHGVCNAVLLPYVMEFNGGFPGISGRFRKVAYALGIPLEECMKDEEAVYMCTEYIRNLSRSLSLPGSLKELSIEKPDFEAMADAAMKDSCMEDNYVKPEKHQVIEVYQRAFMNIINET